jgi:hypothetical protein
MLNDEDLAIRVKTLKMIKDIYHKHVYSQEEFQQILYIWREESTEAREGAIRILNSLKYNRK